MRRRFMITIVAAGLVVMPVAQTAIAQSTPQTEAAPRVIAPEDRASKEQVEKLFNEMRLKQQMQGMMTSMASMMKEQLTQQIKTMAGQNIPEDKQQAIDKVMHKYMDRAMTLYPVSEMLDDMTAIYQKHLSKEDVDAYIAFYASPAGQHLLDEQPAIMREYLPMVSQRMQDRTKTLTEEMMKDMEQVAKPDGSSN